MRESVFFVMMDAAGAIYGGEAVLHCGKARDPHRTMLFRVMTAAAAAVVILLLTGAVMIWRMGRQSMRVAYVSGEYAAADAVKFRAELYGAAHENSLRFDTQCRYTASNSACFVNGHSETLAFSGSGIYSISSIGADNTHLAQTGLCYSDFASGETVYLCAKPECLHDGSAFCNATSSAYSFHSLAYFDNMLYAVATKHTGSSEQPDQVMLLGCQPDGSGITELAVLSDFGAAFNCEMIAHRGALWIYAAAMRETPNADTLLEKDSVLLQSRYGLYHYDISARQLTWITGSTEDAVSCGADAVSDLQGAGDYVYFRQSAHAGSSLGEGLYQVDARTGVIRGISIRGGVFWGYIADEAHVYYLMKPYPASEETAKLAELHTLSLSDGTETVSMIPRSETGLLASGGHIFRQILNQAAVSEYSPDGGICAYARCAEQFLPKQREGDEPIVISAGISSDGYLWYFCDQCFFGYHENGSELTVWDGRRLFLRRQRMTDAFLPANMSAVSPDTVETLPTLCCVTQTHTRTLPPAEDTEEEPAETTEPAPADSTAPVEAHSDELPVYTREEADLLPDRDRYFRLSDGSDNVALNRTDRTLLGTAGNACLFPQSIAMGFLRCFADWHIAGVTEQIGRTCAVIEGTCSGGTFDMSVDIETGALLCFHQYNSDRTLSGWIEVQQITFAEQIACRQRTE